MSCIICKYFLILCRWTFHFLDGIFWRTSIFKFGSQVYIFFSFITVLWMPLLRKHCLTQGHKWKWKSCSCVQLFLTPWLIQSMEFSRPEEWVAIPSSPPGELPNPGIKPRSPALQADSLPAQPPGEPKNTGMGSLSLL